MPRVLPKTMGKNAALWKSTKRLIKSKLKSPDDVEYFLALLNYLEKDGIVIITENSIDHLRIKICKFLSIQHPDLISGVEYEGHDDPTRNKIHGGSLISESEPFHLEFPNASEEHMGGFEDVEIDTKIDLSFSVNQNDGDPLGNYEPNMIPCPPVTLASDPLDTSCNTAPPSSPIKRKLEMKNLKFILVPNPKPCKIQIQERALPEKVQKEEILSKSGSRLTKPDAVITQEKKATVQTRNSISAAHSPEPVHGHGSSADDGRISKNQNVYTKRKRLSQLKVEKIKSFSQPDGKVVTIYNKVEPQLLSNSDKSEHVKPPNLKVYVKRPKLAKPIHQTEKAELIPEPMSGKSLDVISEAPIVDPYPDLDDFSSVNSPSPPPILENPRLPPTDPSVVHFPHPINKTIAKEIHIPRFPCRSKLKPKLVNCPTCGRPISKLYLKMHMKTHNGVSRETPQLCPICGKSISTSHNLAIHTRRMHSDNPNPDSRFRPYLCDQCPKAYFSQGDLNHHLKVHEGLRPHVCYICKKAFTHKISLRNHSEIHAEEKTIKCTYCPRAFRSKRYLTQHLGIHTGVRKHKCEPCGLDFVQIGSLIYHNRKHHPKQKE